MSVSGRWTDFRGLPLMPTRIPAVDALVAFVPEGQPIRAAVQKTLDRIGSGRWFTVAGGHELLVPYEGGQYDRAEFNIRPKAWDHEICSGCQGRVPAMTPCWVTEHGPFKVLCTGCKAQMDAESESA